MRYEDGYWRCEEGGWPLYQQRFDPLAPAPTADGWELTAHGDAPAPTVHPSWERELLFEGKLYRQ